jgi:2-dehydropantoate 2-reductase
MNNNKIVLVFGVGAIGGSVGAWVAEKYNDVYFYDLPAVIDSLKKNGITSYLQDHKKDGVNVKVNTISDLAELPNPDVIILAVKNYSLDKASSIIRETVNGEPVVVALQNGQKNQQVLPKYFQRVVYGVVGFNAWLDDPGVIGYQNKGPIVIGTPDNSLKTELCEISKLFNLGVGTISTDHLHDAVHTKMIVNLTNSLTTLIGHSVKEITDVSIFQRLLTNLTYEGVKIVKAAGYNECKIGNMPPWRLMWAGANLPQFVTRIPFNQNVKKMVISSMAQDIIQNGRSDSELESINGYFLDLAEKNRVDAPFNRAVYDLCKKHFGKDKFEPIELEEVWSAVQLAM